MRLAAIIAAALVPAGAAAETRFSALSQVDAVLFRESSEDDVDPSTGEPLNEDRFVLRRARVGYEYATAFLRAKAELELGYERALALSPYEASVAARYSRDFGRNGAVERLEATATLGLFRIPFGDDAVERVDERPWLERTTFAKALFPGQRDLGVGVDVRFGVFCASLAFMNGEPLGEGRFAGLDATRKKDVVGRVGLEARPTARLRVRAGVSGLSGEGLHPGTPGTKERLAWSDGNENGLVEVSELGVIPGTPSTPSEPFPRFALGADARLGIELPLLGELELRAEIVRARDLDRGLVRADPVARGRDVRELGWALGIAQEVTPYVEVAARYDVYDPDSDARRRVVADVVPVDARYRTLALAVSGKLSPFRLVLELELRDNALGVSPSGAPERLADDSLTLRGEFSY